MEPGQNKELFKNDKVKETAVIEFDQVIQYKPCISCNGFYGPNHKDTYCRTCHDFLFLYDEDEKKAPPHCIRDFKVQLGPKKKPVAVLNPRCDFLIDRSAFNPRDIDINHLPPEVLIPIFAHLPGMSMWMATQVSDVWHDIILHHVTAQNDWKLFVKHLWPLFNASGVVKNWFKVYSALIHSSNCLKCLLLIEKSKTPVIGRTRMHSVHHERETFREEPIDGIDAFPSNLQCIHWTGTINGPVGSPYEGGLFFLYIYIPKKYPLIPPVPRFITKIYHPNVSRHGDIGIDSLNWYMSTSLLISQVLILVQSILTDPYGEVCMEPEIGKMYLTNRPKFEEEAKRWTRMYAMTHLFPNEEDN